jgi:hypothetical protein
MKNVISLKVRILGSNPFLTREYLLISTLRRARPYIVPSSLFRQRQFDKHIKSMSFKNQN